MKTIKRTGFVMIVIVVLLLSFVSAATRTFYVQETDFVKILPEAVDDDNDDLTYEFSAPLDEKGEWQTGFDDAGEYEVEITVSDGENEVVENVLLVVEDKNQAPELKDNKVVVDEGEVVSLKSLVKDGDKDVLVYSFNTPFDSNGEWQTTNRDAGEYVVQFSVNDGEFTKSFNVEIVVNDVNQKPEIVDVFSGRVDVEVKENEVFSFYADAVDGDGDSLEYLWLVDGNQISSDKEDEFVFGYGEEGKHSLDLIVSDGKDDVSLSWEFIVRNVNREPFFEVVEVSVEEGSLIETGDFDLPVQDKDGDVIEYEFDFPFIEGVWQTGFDDAGVYEIEVTASDKGLEFETYVIVEVVNVNRKPIVEVPVEITVKENQELQWEIEVYDEDGDDVSLEVRNMPADAELTKDNVFTWIPSYGEIQRSGNVLSKVLQFVGVEKYFLREKERVLEIEVCDNQDCVVKEVNLIVMNVNRAPVLEEMEMVSFAETDKVMLYPVAYDEDGDKIRFSFTSPVSKRSGSWETGYEDEGEYTIYVAASDGELEDIKPIVIKVDKTNRIPSIEVNHKKVVVNEGEEFTLRTATMDKDSEDTVDVRVDSFAGQGYSLEEGVFVWQAPYDSVEMQDSLWNDVMSKSTYLNRKFNTEKVVETIVFAGSDGVDESYAETKVTIKNVNQRPEIIDYSPTEEFVVRVGEPIVFHVAAQDADGDELNYKWKFNLAEDAVVGATGVERVFSTAGPKKVKVIVSDGRDSVEKVWYGHVVREVENNVITAVVEETKFEHVEERNVEKTPQVDATYKTYVIDDNRRDGSGVYASNAGIVKTYVVQ